MAVDRSVQLVNTPAWETREPVYEADALNPQLDMTPWAGHRDFAYDLVSLTKPSLVVELGVYYGCSFFAFCQAIKDFRLNTCVVGIDTWKGDEHAGFYGEEVFDVVKRTKEQSFPGDQFVLRRSAFGDAVAEFRNESVDLLHIDGLHTYEAVRSDYLTWLPKLAADGVVLMHDVAESSGYESARFWSELKQQHPHFEFTHSWGLGILFPKGRQWYDACVQLRLADQMRGYRYRAEYLLCSKRAQMDAQWLKEQMDKNWVRSEEFRIAAEGLQHAVEAERKRADDLERLHQFWPFAFGKFIVRSGRALKGLFSKSNR